MSRHCAYVTHGWGIHDERWVCGLAKNGIEVETLSIGRGSLGTEEVRHRLTAGTGPVIAGPLTSVTRELLGLSRPIYGLSWGFDLIELQGQRQDLSWLSRLAGVITDTQHTRNIALKAGVQESRLYLLPWGVDLDQFTPDGPKNTHLALAKETTILSLRALEKEYRVEDVIEAFSLLSPPSQNLHLIVGNDGSGLKAMKELATERDLSDRITFIGKQPEKDLPALLRAVDVFVTASQIDGTSVTLLQAMACGTVVVGSDTPGNLEWIVPGSTGIIFRAKDINDLSEKLGQAATLDSEQRLSLIQSARTRIERLADWKANVAKFSHWLHSAHAV